jgi:hypothetical protein
MKIRKEAGKIQMAHTGQKNDGIVKKGGAAPTKAAPAPRVSNHAPKPPPGSGQGNKK